MFIHRHTAPWLQIGQERPGPDKEKLIREMVRSAPDEECVQDVVEALSAYPVEALERVHDYGTRVEVYDFDHGDQVPDYLPTLANPNTLGAYNTQANVLGLDRDNLAPFVLLHEFAHALDASLGDLSETPEWKGAHRFAEATDRVVRPYAKHDSAEYLAENTAAFLIADDSLFPLIERGLEEHLGTEGLSEREYMQMNQNFCNGRLKSIDPDGHRLVGQMLEAADDVPALPSRPAMTAEQWHLWQQAQAAA
ncbi:MAG: hypothetical protein KC910_04250 [Candidatus Eremiobacteraeota bacterium]|nr:hypothetical protein [Candidatus Eremiobacteraeota bacterium]